MWNTEVIRTTTASQEAIWELWSDVANWNLWDADVEGSSLIGNFEVATKGALKPKGGPKTKFAITDLVRHKSFINRSKLPLCTIDFIHTMRSTNEGIELSHRIEMRGLMSGFFSKVMGKNMAKGLPDAVDNLIKMAENGK